VDATIVQIALFGVAGLSASITTGIGLWIRSSQAHFRLEIREWHEEQGFVTSKELDAALTAFADSFMLKLLETMNGDGGFVRKATCEITAHATTGRLDDFRDRIQRQSDSIRRLERKINNTEN